jgi:NAD(P)-dependent dehydrogenase (short-subunit alcohol dehydrogenase family)
MSDRLAGKVSIITGARSGFGEAISKRFYREVGKEVVADIYEKDGKPCLPNWYCTLF